MVMIIMMMTNRDPVNEVHHIQIFVEIPFQFTTFSFTLSLFCCYYFDTVDKQTCTNRLLLRHLL